MLNSVNNDYFLRPALAMKGLIPAGRFDFIFLGIHKQTLQFHQLVWQLTNLLFM